MLDIPDSAFDDSDRRSPEQLDALWQDVVEIYEEAAECEEYHQDENAWGSGVIQSILKIGAKHHPLLHVKNVLVWTNWGQQSGRVNETQANTVDRSFTPPTASPQDPSQPQNRLCVRVFCPRPPGQDSVRQRRHRIPQPDNQPNYRPIYETGRPVLWR